MTDANSPVPQPDDKYETIPSQLPEILRSMAKSLVILASAVPAPHYRRALHTLNNFEWKRIAANVVAKDSAGNVVCVEWNGQRFSRRESPPKDKKGKAVWFSRKVGSGETNWQILITFKEYQEGANDDSE
jgi:hypothetical protein